LKILYVSAEVAPFAKVGGLADVAGSLPKELRAMGHDVRVLMPAYGMVEHDPKFAAKTDLGRFPVRLSSTWTKLAYLKECNMHGVPVYLLGTDEWFNTTTSSQTVYQPGYEQYLFLAKGALAACKKLGWIPDIVHCNDWHTGFLPVILNECGDKTWDETASVFSIHNLAYQGEFGQDVLQKLDLPEVLYNLHQLETYGSVNFLKAGCVFSDRVNTVSPTYSREIQTPEYGCRLEGLMKHLSEYGRLSGILNGIDLEEFNPATDPHIAANFSVADPTGKAMCKQAIQKELGLPVDLTKPLAGVVSRPSSQKGMDLLLSEAPRLFELGLQLIVQGLGDPWLATEFTALQRDFPDQFRFVEKFDADLAQRVYAGSDLFLMPSCFEPCGLGQMIALRYGTIPVVRHTGGLADTVFEGVNGFVFYEQTGSELFAAVKRALDSFSDGPKWKKFVVRGLESDLGWMVSARKYVDLYEAALQDRRGLSTAQAV